MSVMVVMCGLLISVVIFFGLISSEVIRFVGIFVFRNMDFNICVYCGIFVVCLRIVLLLVYSVGVVKWMNCYIG